MGWYSISVFYSSDHQACCLRKLEVLIHKQHFNNIDIPCVTLKFLKLEIQPLKVKSPAKTLLEKN